MSTALASVTLPWCARFFPIHPGSFDVVLSMSGCRSTLRRRPKCSGRPKYFPGKVAIFVVIPMSKWARDKIVKIARNFVWAGDKGEHAAGGHALVNWKMVCGQKDLGGLGMPDLEKSGRALRLRWPWIQWTGPQRHWAGSILPRDTTNMDLFRASTKITIGNGENTSFWHDAGVKRDPCGYGPLTYTKSQHARTAPSPKR